MSDQRTGRDGLEVTGLSVRIAGRTVLDDVTFTVPPGRRVGVIGASGSGKSMTSLALMGLEPAGAEVRGSIRLDGTELVGMRDRDRARHRGSGIGMVFQEPATALDPLRRVGAQVAEPLRLHRGLDRRA
ncbi:ATP-binding cassette domain-containing protein, partial [Curtobacterium sp. HSID17257]